MTLTTAVSWGRIRPAQWFRDMRRPCLRCGADLPPPDPGWGGRPRQYCGDGCRKAGQRLRGALGRDWWQQQPRYPAWAAAEERKRREQQDRADAERRGRDRQAERPGKQQEEKRRQAEEDRKLLESMPPQVRAGVEAARRAEGERARRQLVLMTLRMELSCSARSTPRSWPGPASASSSPAMPAGQRNAVGRRAGTRRGRSAGPVRQGPGASLAAKDPAQRPDAAISTADSLRAFFPPSGPVGQLRCLVRHRRAGRTACTGLGAVQQERELRRCWPVSGGAASTSSRTQASRRLPGSCAEPSSWSCRSPG